MAVARVFSLLLAVQLLSTAQALPLPGEQLPPTPPTSTHPSSLLRVFLFLIAVPVTCRLVIDYLQYKFSRHPDNLRLLYVRALLLMTTYYVSILVAMALWLYGIIKSSLEVGCAGVGVVLAVYSSNLSRTSSSRLRRILCFIHRCRRDSSISRAQLTYAVDKLTVLVLTVPSHTNIPFDEFVDFLFVCLQLGNEQLLASCIKLGFKTTSSLGASSRLRELQPRLPDTAQLNVEGRRLLSAALIELSETACEQNIWNTIPFAVQVELVMLYLKIVALNLPRDRSSFLLAGDQHQALADVDFGAEGGWIRDFAHRLLQLSSTFSAREERSRGTARPTGATMSALHSQLSLQVLQRHTRNRPWSMCQLLSPSGSGSLALPMGIRA